MAAEETGMGVVEDKVIKNHYASEYIYNQYKDKIGELKESIGIKKAIQDYGISEQDFFARPDEMVEQAFDDQCTGANPRYPLMDEMREIYLNAYYGK